MLYKIIKNSLKMLSGNRHYDLAISLEQSACSKRYNIYTDDLTTLFSSRSNAKIDVCEKIGNDNYKIRRITMSCD